MRYWLNYAGISEKNFAFPENKEINTSNMVVFLFLLVLNMITEATKPNSNMLMSKDGKA
jgi:hypothetical protein